MTDSYPDNKNREQAGWHVLAFQSVALAVCTAIIWNVFRHKSGINLPEWLETTIVASPVTVFFLTKKVKASKQ